MSHNGHIGSYVVIKGKNQKSKVKKREAPANLFSPIKIFNNALFMTHMTKYDPYDLYDYNVNL
jgi:hypothetical protein